MLQVELTCKYRHENILRILGKWPQSTPGERIGATGHFSAWLSIAWQLRLNQPKNGSLLLGET
jgi:hypothetical protein